MRRMAVLAGFSLVMTACDWFAPEGVVINEPEALSGTEETYYFIQYAIEPTEPDPRETLARCLTERGVVLYSTPWCGACQRQKELFGPYAELLNEVNCVSEPERCTQAGVRAVPTWVFPDGSHHVGIRGLQQLARRAQCPYSSQ